MAVFLSPVGGVAAQFFTNNGVPLSGGKLYTYAAGTTTPAATYTSSSGVTAHANPIVLDSGGRVPGGETWLTDGTSYKFLLKDSNDVLIATYDNIVGINSNFVNFFAEEEVQVATAGQTVFTLANPYVPGGNTLSVFVDGVNQYSGSTYSYVETSASTVTFDSGLHVGALVKFTTVQSLTSGQQTDAALVTYNEGGAGAVTYTVRAKLQQTISINDFGASPSATAAANTAAIQTAVTACPEGGTLLVPNGTYQINNAIVIDKAITIAGTGTGKFINPNGGSSIQQTNAAKNAFTLKATAGGYAFGAYGLVDVHFENLAILGPSNASRAARGIGCDVTVNSGDYHIRQCSFSNVNILYFATGIEFVGICYLNDFYQCNFSYCDTGFANYKGAASDRGGQTRIYGTTFDLITDACIQWLPDTNSGDLSMFGCTLADAHYGIVCNEEAQLTIMGCSFENNVKTGTLGAGVYIDIKETNPASDSAKVFIGNKFIANDVSIWLNKTTTTGSTNEWSWPMLIDGNTFIDTVALRITLQAGEPPMSAQNFVLGAANSGTNGGFLATSQISTNFAGRNIRQQSVSRRVTFGPSAAGAIQLPSGMVVTSARMYLTANASSFTGLFGGDADNNTRYYSGVNGQTAPLNTWTTWTPPVPQFIVNSALRQQVVLSGTAGLLGATGVFEIQGYIP